MDTRSGGDRRFEEARCGTLVVALRLHVVKLRRHNLDLLPSLQSLENPHRVSYALSKAHSGARYHAVASLLHRSHARSDQLHRSSFSNR